MPIVYADPSLKDRILNEVAKYDRILQGDGRKLPPHQQENLRATVRQMRNLAARDRLKASAFKEFRTLRESAITLCALPESGEPRRFGAGMLSAGRVGGFSGQA